MRRSSHAFIHERKTRIVHKSPHGIDPAESARRRRDHSRRARPLYQQRQQRRGADRQRKTPARRTLSNGQMRCLFPRSRAPARGMLRGALSRCFCRHGTRRPRGGQPAAAMAAGGAAAGEEQVGRAAPRRERGGGGGGAARGSRPRARRRPAICPRVDALCSSSSEPLSGQCAARGGGAWGAARAPAGGAAEGRLLPSACGACERPSVGLRGEGRGEHARTRTDAMSRVASCPSGAREPHTKQRLRGSARCVCTK